MRKKIKEVRFTSYAGDLAIITFRCQCGCTEFEREPEQSKFSHHEGFYNCSKCGSEHDYCSDYWIKKYIKKPVQLEIF